MIKPAPASIDDAREELAAANLEVFLAAVRRRLDSGLIQLVRAPAACGVRATRVRTWTVPAATCWT